MGQADLLCEKQTGRSKAEDGSEQSVSLPARGLLLLEAVLEHQ